MSKSTVSTAQCSTTEEVALSAELETEGFDILAGQTWIYPTNYTLREYQHNIIQKALFNNTMVSLPTGLGKTFIAAVVMYNFYRWYPSGKIVFMAPTRPLVKQQVDACYNIMSIPKEVTAELTGTKVQTSRKEIWKGKRVFFITPQILQNDLNILTELASKIKCLVFDEAHKAKGNHAYCEVIRKLVPHNKYFRVLGLSATPGNTLNDVLEVIQNLLISHIEIRTDESPDVVPYVFQRSLETVVVPLGGKLQDVRDSYINILEKYTRVLVRYKIINGNCSMLTKGKIFMTMKEFKERNHGNRDGAYSEIMRSLNICITLYHGYELLIRHGLRVFLSFFEEHSEKPLLRGNTDLLSIMQDLTKYLGPAPNVVPLPDGTIQDIPKTCNFGHPKFYKLRDILSDHFRKTNEIESRVIVFCEYRESVMEAYALLLQQKPLIRPRTFVGQSGITQRQQINVIKAFRSGECNTLISTCIGEEGLDVGDVDLIVCFDISNKSPVRMVQRMGRTGRKREGRVVVLVTEGKEQQTLKECLIHKQNLNNHILQSSVLQNGMYAQNPRMIPIDVDPECLKMFITVKKDSTNLPSTNKSSTIKDMFDNISKKSGDSLTQNSEVLIMEFDDRLPQRQEFWNKAHPLHIENCNENKIDFSKKVSRLRSLQPTGQIGHSKTTDLLVSMLQFADSKRYNISTTQVPVINSQIIQPELSIKTKSSPAKNLKQSDIRNMFVMQPSSFQLPQKKNALIEEMMTRDEEQDCDSLYTEIISGFDLSKPNTINSCKICDNLFDCSYYGNITVHFDIKSWIGIDTSTFDVLNIDNLTAFETSLQQSSKCLEIDVYDKKGSCINELEESYSKNIPNIHNVSDFNTSLNQHPKPLPEAEICGKTKKEIYVNDFETSFLRNASFIEEFTKIKDSPFKPPANVDKMLSKCGILPSLDDSDFSNLCVTQIEKAARTLDSPNQKVQNSNINNLLFSKEKKTTQESPFDLKQGHEHHSTYTHLFSQATNTVPISSTPCRNLNDNIPCALNFNSFEAAEFTQMKKKVSKPEETLGFFNMSTIDELFDNSHLQSPVKSEGHSQDTIIYSPPRILSSSDSNALSTSPVLCSYSRSQYLKNKVQKRLFETSRLDEPFTINKTLAQKTLNAEANNSEDIFTDSLIKSNPKQDVEVIKDVLNNSKQDVEMKNDALDVSAELFDDSDFIPINTNAKESVENDDQFHKKVTSGIEDMVDLSFFGLNSLQKTPQKEQTQIFVKTPTSKCKSGFSQKELQECATELNDFCDETFLNLFFDAGETKTEIKLEDKEPAIKNSLKKRKLSISLTQTNKNSKLKTNDIEENTGDVIIDLCNTQKSPILPRSQLNRSVSQWRASQRSQVNKISSLTNKETTEKEGKSSELFNFVKPNLFSKLHLSSKLNKNSASEINWYKKGSTNKPSTSTADIKILNDSDNSDDDFEISCKSVKKKFGESKETFKVSPIKPRSKLSCIKNQKETKQSKKKLEHCDFIDLEADVSLDGNESLDSTMEGSDGEFEASFVDDETQNLANNTMMHAHYLKSIRSVNNGKFKIPHKITEPIADVCSQPISQENNTYLNDTFCVGSQNTEDFHINNDELSELELAELILEDERKRKKSKKASLIPRKKQRLIIISSSDSE